MGRSQILEIHENGSNNSKWVKIARFMCSS
jgi:hypothetical protein